MKTICIIGLLVAFIIPVIHKESLSENSIISTKTPGIYIDNNWCSLYEIKYDGEKYIVLYRNGKMSICPKIKKEINDNK